jgi:hypothetical protein
MEQATMTFREAFPDWRNELHELIAGQLPGG